MQEQLRAIKALVDKGEIKRAEILIARCLRSGIDTELQAHVLIYRARTRLLSVRPDDALSDLLSARAILKDRFETAELLELLADCYFARFELSSVGFADRSDTLQAKTIYQHILEHFVDYENLGWVYYQIGRLELTDNRVEQALVSLQQSLLSPSHIPALTAYCYERLGFIAFYEQRDLNRAMTMLNKAVDTYPPSEDRLWLVQVHILRSRVLREMYKYDRAIQAAEMAVAVASSAKGENKIGLSEALFTLGELLTKLEGRERDVITCLQQFLQVSKKPLGVDVTWSRVHEMLGDAYFKVAQYDEAAAAYLAALQYNPYHPWEISVYYRIARTYYQKHDYEKAVGAIQHMLAAAETEGQDVNDYRVYDVLGNAQFALGHYDKAVEAYSAALRIAPPNAENLDKIKTYYTYAQELRQPL